MEIRIRRMTLSDLDEVMEIGRLAPSEHAAEIVISYAMRKAAKA